MGSHLRSRPSRDLHHGIYIGIARLFTIRNSRGSAQRAGGGSALARFACGSASVRTALHLT